MNELRIFVERTNNLIESKLILTDKTISHLLKFIATNETLLACLAESLKDVSYANEFARAKTTVTQPNGQVYEKLKTPPTDARLFSFVVCLLTEFDTDKRDLVEFLQQFYTNKDNNIAYAEFVNQFIKPFKRAGEKLLSVSVAQDNTYDKIENLADQYFNPERIYINKTTIDELFALIDTISVKLDGESFFSQQERSDSKEITIAMKNSLLSKNPKLIKIIWIGFNHTLSPIKAISVYVKRINSILLENNLI